jgi:hypothetical protein
MDSGWGWNGEVQIFADSSRIWKTKSTHLHLVQEKRKTESTHLHLVTWIW